MVTKSNILTPAYCPFFATNIPSNLGILESFPFKEVVYNAKCYEFHPFFFKYVYLREMFHKERIQDTKMFHDSLTKVKYILKQ